MDENDFCLYWTTGEVKDIIIISTEVQWTTVNLLSDLREIISVGFLDRFMTVSVAEW